MNSTFDQLLQNIDALRKKESKPKLTQQQVVMIQEQVEQREQFGRFSLLPQKDK